MFSSRKPIRCYLKSIPPATDAKSCAGAGCDDAADLSASLAIAHAKKMRGLMTGSHDIGRSGASQVDDGLMRWAR